MTPTCHLVVLFATSALVSAGQGTVLGVVTTLAGGFVNASAVSSGDGFGAEGNSDGVGTAVAFREPLGAAFMPGGTIAIIADTKNHQIRRVNASSGLVTTITGTVGAATLRDGLNSAFYNPSGVAVYANASLALVVRGVS